MLWDRLSWVWFVCCTRAALELVNGISASVKRSSGSADSVPDGVMHMRDVEIEHRRLDEADSRRDEMQMRLQKINDETAAGRNQ